MTRKLRHLDLFSGIGGFSLGLEATGGFQTIGFSEIDPWCCAVLKKHRPKVKNYGPVESIPKVGCDILTGGFPCQPFSQAGEQRGAKDDRHLWPAMFHVIKTSRPTWCVCENVPGIIGMELDNCISDLEGEGYEVQTVVVPACAVDARHRRDRVWIVAYNDGQQWGASRSDNFKTRTAKTFVSGDSQIISDAMLAGKRGKPRQSKAEKNADVADSKSTGQQGSKPARNSRAIRQLGEFRQAVSNSTSNRWNERHSHAGRNSERARATEERPGFADGMRWSIEPSVGRVADGIPYRAHRLKGLGNAIVPQIAQIFGEIILTIESQKL